MAAFITAAITAVAGWLGTVGAAVGVTGALSSVVVGGAIVGAVVGGVVSAVKGENVFQGMLKGGLVGAAVGGALGLGAQAIAAKEATLISSMETATVSGEPLITSGGAQVGEIKGGADLLGVDTTLAKGGGEAVVKTAAGATYKPTALAAKGVGGTKEGLLGGFLSDMSGSDKALLLSSGASMVSGMFGPDEEELMRQQAELEAQSKRITGVPDIYKVQGTVNWDRFDVNKIIDQVPAGLFERNRFSDENLYRTNPSLLSQQYQQRPQQAPANQTQAPQVKAPTPTAPQPKPEQVK